MLMFLFSPSDSASWVLLVGAAGCEWLLAVVFGMEGHGDGVEADSHRCFVDS